jgi:Ca2+-binding EF-hand superfamily protein
MGPGGDELETSVEALFRAYDVDENGEISRSEFLSIEMRLSFEEGDVFKGDAGMAKFTLADRGCTGALSFEEFRSRTLTTFEEQGFTKAEIIKHLNDQVMKTLTERAKMGPRFHAGIRQVLKQIFSLFDCKGDGHLTPEEWMAAQKTVATEVNDDFEEGWVEESRFASADTNGDGLLDLAEFLESSFKMFDGVKRRTDQILATLQRVARALEKERMGSQAWTPNVAIWVQSAEIAEFQPPSKAFQNVPTEEASDKGRDAWMRATEVKLPAGLQTAEDVAGLIRLSLKWPPETWISCFYIGPPKEGAPRPITLLRGGAPGEGTTSAMLTYFTKQNADLRLFVKNKRKRPHKLQKQQRAVLEEKESLLAKKTGAVWGLDWETQLIGEGMPSPPKPMVVMLGDAVIVEVPVSDEGGEYRFVPNVYMDRIDILSKPCDETVEVKKKKKKKVGGGEPDPLLQLTFVAVREGKCVIFVDLSWEDQEEKLAGTQKLLAPCSYNSAQRIGPIEVEVQKPTVKEDRATMPLMWWNGEQWSKKKGAAKKKKGKK